MFKRTAAVVTLSLLVAGISTGPAFAAGTASPAPSASPATSASASAGGSPAAARVAPAVTGPVTVTTQPTDTAVVAGTDASFTAAAQDSTPADVPVTSWQSLAPTTGAVWTDIPATAALGTYTVAAATVDLSGTSYRATFDDGNAGTLLSDAAVLTVTAAPVDTAPVITTQPVSQSFATSSPFTLTAAASGTPTPTVQWQSAASATGPWADIPGETASTLNGTSPVTPATSFYYQAVFTNSVSSATTDVATISTAQIAAPAPVASVALTLPAPNQLKVTWHAAAGATSYVVKVYSATNVVVKTTTTSALTVTYTLAAGRYHVTVTATNAGGAATPFATPGVTVLALVQNGTTSSGVIRPFRDAFQDTAVLRFSSTFATAGQVRILNSRGAVVRTWANGKFTNWAISFNGRKANGAALPFGAYRAQFIVGRHAVATRAIAIVISQVSVPSAAWAPGTVFPAVDHYIDSTRLTIRSNIPATETVVITGTGKNAKKTYLKVNLPRRQLNGVTWAAHYAGKVLPAGKYLTTITAKGGEGTPRKTTRTIVVSAKKMVGVKFSGAIYAQAAFRQVATGNYNAGPETGGITLNSSQNPQPDPDYLNSDEYFFGVRLPSSAASRYSGVSIYACSQYSSVGNPNGELGIEDLHGHVVSSTGFNLNPSAGCASGGVPSAYIAPGGVVRWAAGNFGENDSSQYIQYFGFTGTKYVLK